MPKIKPFERFSNLETLLDVQSYEKLQKHLENQIKYCNQLYSWKETKVFKFDGDLNDEIKKVEDKNVQLLNECLIMVSLLTHILTKFSHLKNMKDDYLMERKMKHEALKKHFTNHILGFQNAKLNFEEILDMGKTLIRDLRNYEMIKSQTAILNDWIENDSLVEKAISLNYKVMDFVKQMDSENTNEQKR